MPELAVQRALLIGPGGSTLMLPENPLRRYALLVNDGNVDCYLGLSAPAAYHTGIRLNMGGGNYEINSTNLFRGEINGYCFGVTRILMVEW